MLPHAPSGHTSEQREVSGDARSKEGHSDYVLSVTAFPENQLTSGSGDKNDQGRAYHTTIPYYGIVWYRDSIVSIQKI